MNLLSSGLVRGLLAQTLGTSVGMAFVMAVRVALGLPAWNREPVVVGGALVGAIAFVFGVGAVSDWMKLARGEQISDDHTPDPDKPAWIRYFNVDYDHKVIGIQYGVTSMILLLVAGLFAMIFRTELAKSGMQFLPPEVYNTLMSLHGIVMIGSILLGVGAMSNYLVPLMIGANDMAFPRLNSLAFWVNVPGIILLLSSLFLGGFDTGWTGYPPNSVYAALGVQMFFLGVYFIGLSSILGSINLIVTIVRMRAPGMTYMRMPIFVWAALATALIGFTATQLIGLSFQMVILERIFDMSFFDGTDGGNPILFQHLFWFYSHPAVYVFVLPGLGIISELLPVFARKPLFGYKWVAFSSMGIALVGFFVWAHHMFTSGMATYLRVPFMYSTMLVAVPTGVKFFSWVGTIWRGKISFPTPMLFTLGAVVVFLIGGLTGPPNGLVATNLHLHDTYWVVGHFHNTMFGGFIFPFFAAIYFWFPKMSGRKYSETLGKLHFWLMFPAFLIMSLVQMRVGLLGMRRRISDYDPALGFDDSHMVITIAGFVIGVSVLIMVWNLIRSARRGEQATGNLWNSRSPEWQIPSPVPLHNYEQPIAVVGKPYDYGLPGSVYVDMNPSASSDK
ncbi:MAG: cytochrome c oxidase subunit I [Chloroflexi bacterium]|nr:cytochrome c oxidase subunit I [Chloroflexota bacterium]